MNYVDPISYLQLIFIHIGGRFLKFNITPVQEKILNSKITQGLIFYSLLLFSTKDATKAFIIVFISYLLLYFILNENSKYNMISKKWLIKNKFIEDDNFISDKQLYLQGFKNLN
jgi:hypothetical protein|tara:strand:- start:5922 stop:6263 length:342 start_codon:yes stop_codon:yes gene_type:complete